MADSTTTFKQQLKDIKQLEEWSNLPQDTIKNYINHYQIGWLKW